MEGLFSLANKLTLKCNRSAYGQFLTLFSAMLIFLCIPEAETKYKVLIDRNFGIFMVQNVADKKIEKYF